MATRTFASQPELLERESELAAIDDLIAATPSAPRLLAIEGPPGIGKTALVAAAKRRGQDAGWQVLAARGSELERSFSYGVVRQLFEPLLAALPGDERTDSLAGAAALAAPLFDPDQVAAEPAAADSSLARLHGLYWLTANLAARRPLLVTVDDLHWCDLPSLRWIAYVLPRIEGIDLALVVGVRTEESAGHERLLGQILADPMAGMIRPPPLTAAAATLILRATLSSAVEDGFGAGFQEEAAGNPLLLRELAHVIVAEGLAPTSANVPRLRQVAARAGARPVSLRLSRLPPEARKLAQAVAILGDEVDPRQAAALAGLDEASAFAAASALARLDVLHQQPPLRFVHPLIRSTVYEVIPPLDRERGHARAAKLLGGAGADPERVAAHLLRAAPGQDPDVVATMREAARRAASRGAAESAVAYLRRALAEASTDPERGELLIQLGSAETLVDGEAAVEHLQQAHALMQDPIQRAETALLLGRQLFLVRGDEADPVFLGALDELGGADPELERLLEAGLITNDLFTPSLHRSAAERLERVRGRLAGETVGEKVLLTLLAYHDARAGVPAPEVVALARRALAGGVLVRSGVSGAFFPLCTVLAMADLDEVLTLYDDLLAEAHRRGSTFAYAAAKVFRAQALVWRGDLGEAEADTRDALSAGEAWAASARFAGHAAAGLADALMEQGRLHEAAAVLARVESDESLPDTVRSLFLRDSSSRLRILRGDPAGGIAELLDAGREFERVGSRNPAFISWRSPAALALRELGEADEARRLAADEVDLARIWGAPRALGAALRAAGVVAGGRHGLAMLEEAVQVLSDSPAKLEHAKARTELGAALRRSNQRSAARAHLRQALELATICGATPLAARAEQELLAAGARPRRVALSGVASLTPSERRVAQMAAEGPTNREIAQALFVTQRTVELHLTSIYRKLAINSRSQLAAALAERAPG